MVSRSALLWGSVLIGVSPFVLASTSRAEPGTPALAIAPFDAEEARTHQEAWAEQLGVEVQIENSIGMKLRLIPPGEFMMGSPELEEGRFSDEGPQHRVRLTRPYYLGVYPVTQAQWESIMGNNPSAFSSGERHRDRVSGLSTDDFPVEHVSWEDAQEFIGRLNERSEETGGVYRLPTEAEWEYACRAGTTTRYFFSDDAGDLGEHGWYSENTGGYFGGGRTHPVGQKRPNAWGLYDVHGNVWEWCSDWFSEDYYANSPQEDPTGPESGSLRVYRGGSWNVAARGCRSAHRNGRAPGIRSIIVGFRVAFSPLESSSSSVQSRLSARTRKRQETIGEGGIDRMSATEPQPSSRKLRRTSRHLQGIVR
jgi:formylglycine-generating enzyme required for sulfatase activity